MKAFNVYSQDKKAETIEAEFYKIDEEGCLHFYTMSVTPDITRDVEIKKFAVHDWDYFDLHIVIKNIRKPIPVQ